MGCLDGPIAIPDEPTEQKDQNTNNGERTDDEENF